MYQIQKPTSSPGSALFCVAIKFWLKFRRDGCASRFAKIFRHDPTFQKIMRAVVSSYHFGAG
jgi:hypothetical protein